MFGLYRFVLAGLVAFSHFGVTAAGFNPGQWAVVSFYTLSGLLMARQFQKLARQGNGVRAFYLDRFLRVYPLFFFVLLFALAGSRTSWGVAIINMTLLPLNYSSYTQVPILISPTWSLACEAHFYLLVPLLILCSTKVLRALAGVSLCVFMISPFTSNAGFWAYVGLPGILFTFLSGILISRQDYAFIKIVWPVMLLLLIAFGLTKYLHTGLPTGIHINVAIGYLIAAVAVPGLDRFSANVKWDKFFGLFSYPLFLCHVVVAAILQRHWPISNPFVLLFASILFSGLLILTVEMPFDRLRYRVRGVA